jgi:hypothetical protein
VEEGEPLFFADVCAGPGGFSEYVLWKKKWRCKGFGFTLKTANHDFRSEHGVTDMEHCYWNLPQVTKVESALRSIVLQTRGFFHGNY